MNGYDRNYEGGKHVYFLLCFDVLLKVSLYHYYIRMLMGGAGGGYIEMSLQVG